jgi:hypothetical protein
MNPETSVRIHRSFIDAASSIDVPDLVDAKSASLDE